MESFVDEQKLSTRSNICYPHTLVPNDFGWFNEENRLAKHILLKQIEHIQNVTKKKIADYQSKRILEEQIIIQHMNVCCSQLQGPIGGGFPTHSYGTKELMRMFDEDYVTLNNLRNDEEQRELYVTMNFICES